MATLSTTDLCHAYKDTKALLNVSFELHEGITAIIGPNGAGKTTLINILCGLLQPTKGLVTLDSTDVKVLGKTYYSRIGYCPQELDFYPNFTVIEFLEYISLLKRVEKTTTKIHLENILREVNLYEQRNKKIRTLSGGMKRRLGIAQALLGDPKILILDEPTAGLDPNERIRFKKLIAKLSTEKIVIIATHIISDVENIANQLLFLKHGKVIINDSPQNTLAAISDCVWMIPNIACESFNHIASDLRISSIINRNDNSFEIRVIATEKPLPQAKQVMPNLEDVYVYHYFDLKGDAIGDELVF